MTIRPKATPPTDSPPLSRCFQSMYVCTLGEKLVVLPPRLRNGRQYAETSEGIKGAYADVPCKVVDCSQSDLETFAEVCDFVEEVGAKKAERLGPEGMRALSESVSGQRISVYDDVH